MVSSKRAIVQRSVWVKMLLKNPAKSLASEFPVYIPATFRLCSPAPKFRIPTPKANAVTKSAAQQEYLFCILNKSR